MEETRIETWAQSQYGFYVDRHWTDHLVLEKAPIRLADYQRRILAHCFRQAEDGSLPYDTVAWCEPAKSGKTALLALVHEYFALHIEPPAEQYVISNTKDQATSRAFKALCQSAHWNPHLRLTPKKHDLTLRNGTAVKAIACNYRGEAGARFTLATFDEPWAIMYEDGIRLVSEFKPDPTRTASCRMFAGYAGFTGESELWADLLQSGLKGEPVPELESIDDGRGQPACWHSGGLFVFWSHVCRQPWQTRKWLAGLERELTPAQYGRMVHCDFAASEESFIQEAWWDACHDPGLEPLRPGDQTPLIVAVDASVSGDCSAIVACSRHPKRHEQIAVRFVQVWNPADQPGRVIDQSKTIEPTLRWLCANFNVKEVAFDMYQLSKLTTDLRRERLAWFYEFPQGDGSKENPGRTIADADLRTLIMHREISHSGQPVLREHILNAAAKVTGESRLRIVKKGREPIDAIVALSMAAAEARRLRL